MRAQLCVGPLWFEVQARRYRERRLGIDSIVPRSPGNHVLFIDCDEGREPTAPMLQTYADNFDTPVLLLRTGNGYHIVTFGITPFTDYYRAWSFWDSYSDKMHEILTLKRGYAVLRVAGEVKTGDIEPLALFEPNDGTVRFLSLAHLVHFSIGAPDIRERLLERYHNDGNTVIPYRKYRDWAVPWR